jgi:hypothetical protein
MANKMIPKKPVLKKADPLRSTQRAQKILHIAQAHVAPGMSLERWRAILVQFKVDLTSRSPWERVSDDILAAIQAEIEAAANGGKPDG